MQCVFLGYAMGYKGVICFNIITRKLILSRHVIHDESMFPYKIQSTVSTNEIQHVQSKIQRPIIVQMPIPSVSNIIQSENHNSHEDNISASMSESSAATSSQAPISSPNSISSSNSLSQGGLSHLDHYHITLTPTSMSPILLVHHETQLEVLFPISSPISSNIDESSIASIHQMVTRSKNGVLPQRSYKGYLAALPDLQTLQLAQGEFLVEVFLS